LSRDYLSNEFQERIIAWFKREGRSFYWRTHVLSLWQCLVLELLLKRTRAETVEKFFPSFIAKYNCPEVVMQASDLELEEDLKYLGLQRQRRIALKQIAKTIIRGHNGQVPREYVSLISLTHVGRYIANAVLCFSLNQARPIVDTNVARVLTRFHGLEMPKDAREEWIWELAKKMLPEENWKEYNYSLLDLGALICRTRPKCRLCIVVDVCTYSKQKFLCQGVNLKTASL